MTTTGSSIAVIDYGIGNLHSAHKALRAVGANAILTDDPTVIDGAAAVVLPGVGNFGACMTALRSRNLDRTVLDAIESQRPFLGICVGMQMLFDGSQESPDIPGLGVLSGDVQLLPGTVKRPQMQWNKLDIRRADPVLTDPEQEEQWMYFVHSYAAVTAETEVVVATVDYGSCVTAACRHDNVFATQFHPEKSSSAGLALLRRWVDTITEVSR